MKIMKCEMCDGNDFAKQDGMFVCQNCGTKYSTEEAKKLMVEGTVTIDTSAATEKNLANARRARSKEDWDEAEKYYNLVEADQPENIEAIFYSGFAKAKASLMVNEQFKREAIFDSLIKGVSIIDDNYDIKREKELKPLIQQIVNDVIAIYGSKFTFTETTTKNQYGTTKTDNKGETYALFNRLANETANTLRNIVKKFPEDRRKDVVYFYEMAGKIYDKAGYYGNALGYAQLELEVHYAIKKYVPSHDVTPYIAAVEAQEKAQRSAAVTTLIVTAVVIVGIIAFFVWILS